MLTIKYKHLTYMILTVLSVISCSTGKGKTYMLAGRYAPGGEKSLYVYEVNTESGELLVKSENDAGPNPSYLCYSDKNGLLYAANEVMDFRGGKGGGITTLKFDPEKNTFEQLSSLEIPDGSPCYISLSPEEDYLFLANYTGGSISVVRLNRQGLPEKITQSVVFNDQPEKSSHPHMIDHDPAGKFIYLTDLGYDRIRIYTWDPETGQLTEKSDHTISLPEGSGPRHFTFNRDGTRLYVINELNSTITGFSIAMDGKPDSLQNISTLREGFTGVNACADIHLSENGKFLFASNRGENSIAVFSVKADGTLVYSASVPTSGNWPRNFLPDPSDRYIYVANQRSGNISVLRWNSETGGAEETGMNYEIIEPACLKFFKPAK